MEPLIIENGNDILAIIITKNYRVDGISFFTPDDYSQQLAYMHHPTGKSIQPHLHNRVYREVHYTQEVLVIKSGKLRVDFFDEDKNYLKSHILEGGDVIMLSSGGHGFYVLEEVEMYEIKQGPYVGEVDKTRFKNTIGELKFD